MMDYTLKETVAFPRTEQDFFDHVVVNVLKQQDRGIPPACSVKHKWDEAIYNCAIGTHPVTERICLEKAHKNNYKSPADYFPSTSEVAEELLNLGFSRGFIDQLIDIHDNSVEPSGVDNGNTLVRSKFLELMKDLANRRNLNWCDLFEEELKKS